MPATTLQRDQLGSVRAITRVGAGGVPEVIEKATYKPFGAQSEWALPGNAAPETKGRTRERYDADAGLQYLNARYYDPELSLFLQPDWFEVTKAGVGTNRFSYSFNDPVNKFDPVGNLAFAAVIPPAIELLKWVGVAVIAGVGIESTISNPLVTNEDLDRGQGGFIPDPTASDPVILGNPAGDPWPELNTEGFSVDVDSGPIVLADPWGDDYSPALDGKILASTPGSYEIFV